MEFNIMEKVEEIVAKLKADKNLKAKFEKDPVKALEDILGVDLPDEAIKGVIDGVKAKLPADTAGGIFSKLGNLFKKK